MVLFRSVGGVGGQWSGGGLGFANLLVVAWVCWDVRFGGSDFIFTGFEFNFFGFKFAGFVFLFKYIMCSCLIYQFYLGLFFSCGFYYFSGFVGLICWRIRWRKGILII